MNSYKLSIHQCLSILTDDSVTGYLSEALPKEYQPCIEDLPVTGPINLGKHWPKLNEIPEPILLKAAEYVFIFACHELNKFDSSNGDVVVTELAGVYGLWSETTDWLFFDSEKQAIEFATNNLCKG